MKKLLLLSSLCVLSTAGFAGELNDYEAIKNALTNGQSVRLVTNFAQCTTLSPTVLKTMMVGIFTPNEIGFTDNHIATSMTHFTMNDPFFPNKPVFEFARYTITPDNNISVSLQVLEAPTYIQLMDKISFNCKINEAVKVYS